MSNVRSIRNVLIDILREELKRRSYLPPEDWATSERMAMFWAINAHRQLLGKSELPMTGINWPYSIDSAGNYKTLSLEDYALLCAQLVLE